jgi:polyferredoxin
MDYPRGLVKYTTENKMEGRETTILRPRIIIYVILLVSILSGIFYSIETRDSVALNILRDRNALYREKFEGTISNSYTIKVLNMDLIDHDYTLKVTGIEGLQSSIKEPIKVKAGQVLEMPLLLSAEPESLHHTSLTIKLTLQAVDDINVSTESEGRFIGPIDP